MAKRKLDFSDLCEGPSKKADLLIGTPIRSDLVPNKFPTINAPYRIAIIGESPSTDDTHFKSPLSGTMGRFFDTLLSRAGIARHACYVGNVIQHTAPKAFRKGRAVTLSPSEKWDKTTKGNLEEERQLLISEGITRLNADIAEYRPNLLLLLGKGALWFASGKQDIGNWRGSLFTDSNGVKCISSYSPAACNSNYEWTIVLLFDLHKAKQEGTSPILDLPIRQLNVGCSLPYILDRLESIQRDKPPISIDIEGGVELMSCIGIAPAGDEAFIVPFVRGRAGAMWTIDEEVLIWRALCAVLEDVKIPKILQNSLYDRFVLQYAYGIVVRGITDDTMLKHWEKFCELEKGLGFLCSIYTREPYYKGDRKSDNDDTFFRYCCKDAACTFEINNAINLDTLQTQHYEFNMTSCNILLYIELRGIRYDSKNAKIRLGEVNQHIYRLQHELDQISGRGVPSSLDRTAMLSLVQDTMCYKKDSNRPKADYIEEYAHAQSILQSDTPITDEIRARIGIDAKLSLNIKSTAFKEYLYVELGLPPQKNRATGEVSTDNESLLKLKKTLRDEINDLTGEAGPGLRVVETAMHQMELRTRSQNLAIKADPDGRIRCGYNIVGTVTGRISSYTSPTGSGYNLQTIPDDYTSFPIGHPLRQGMRDLFLADPGYHFFQCDLKGSDGWTIGAHMARLGDNSMLEDLRQGIKPASRICYMLRHGNHALEGKERDEVKSLLKEIKKDDWDYFACKVGIWGTCYLMGPDLLGSQIAEESYGKVTMTKKEVGLFQHAVFSAYNVKRWHAETERKLKRNPIITAASGHTRRFYGRSNTILGEALAHEPQANTTYATNLAAFNLWNDKENREGKELKIQPLHQVHDALLGQFKYEATEWAVDKIKSYFLNSLVIAGISITIPFEGNYGISWGDLKVGTI